VRGEWGCEGVENDGGEVNYLNIPLVWGSNGGGCLPLVGIACLSLKPGVEFFIKNSTQEDHGTFHGVL
jgi:hypothetical protein